MILNLVITKGTKIFILMVYFPLNLMTDIFLDRIVQILAKIFILMVYFPLNLMTDIFLDRIVQILDVL